jgi:hypothetical protein
MTIIDALPPRKLRRDEVAALTASGSIEAVAPILHCRKCQRVILFSLETQDGGRYYIGFHPDRREWKDLTDQMADTDR